MVSYSKFPVKSIYSIKLIDRIDKEVFTVELRQLILQIPEPMAILCSPEHAFAGRESIRPEDLSGEPLILTEPCCGYRALFEYTLPRFNIKSHLILEASNVQAIKQLVIFGMGITFLPQVAVEEELMQKRLVKLNWAEPDFHIYTQVVYHKTRRMSAALKAFIDLLNEMKHSISRT